MNKTTFILAALFFGISLIGGFSDIAPTQYSGLGIKPISAPGIRMLSAKVDIEWGTPCKLSAVFILENQTSMPTDVQLGFPVTLPPELRSKDTLNFSMSFDDVPENHSDITEVGTPKDNFPPEITWYRCHHTFPPGKTNVTVATKLPATLVYRQAYQEDLSYCIETGASWAGSIGSEEVTIHFPSPVTKEMILTATPPGGIIKGNTISWQFINFKPQGTDHDIHIVYWLPQVATVLADLREKLAQSPDDTKLKLKMAKHLFALTRSDTYAAFPPSHLSANEYKILLRDIKNPSDLALFKSRYRPSGQGGYDEISSEWSKERIAMNRILNEADFQPEDRSPYVDEARGLLEKLLKEQPSNPEIWNFYLAYYPSFRFAGGGSNEGFAGQDTYFQPFLNLVKEASTKCPADPTLQLWYKEICQPTTAPAPDALQKALAKLGVFDVDFHSIDHGYY
jgi:hypothetical protein